MRETDTWPVVQARWFAPWTGEERRPVRVLVVHDMEYPEQTSAALDVAHYFATTETKASAHVCIDAQSIIQCVADNDVAWAAPGANHDGIQIELAGYGKQTREQWLDPFGIALIAIAADATAQYCLKYDILPRHITNEQLADGMAGIVGHDQVTAVYHKSDHTDPGPNFPWDYFTNHVVSAYGSRY